jgi:hypothetical protein
LNTTNIYYAVALQIEDYFSSSSSVTPMSSFSLQFLYYGYTEPTGCKTANVTEYVIAQVNCSGKTIVDFVTSAPVSMKKSATTNTSPGW